MSKNQPSADNNLNYPNCPYRRLLDLIGDKWTTLVMKALATHGTMRYGQIKRHIGGVSHKMLTQTLRRLEEKKLVERVVYPVVPPHVEYTLTQRGESLLEPLKALESWVEANESVLMGDIETELVEAVRIP